MRRSRSCELKMAIRMRVESHLPRALDGRDTHTDGNEFVGPGLQNVNELIVN